MLELRRVGEEDWPRWRTLRHRALAEAPDAFGSTLSEWQGNADLEERWRGRLRDVPFNLIAGLDGGDVGQVSATALDEAGVPDLISLWVVPEARGAGVGDALVAAVVDWAEEQASTAVRLWVKAANAPAALLYERHGFLPTGAGAEDEIELRRPLAGVAARRHPSRSA